MAENRRKRRKQVRKDEWIQVRATAAQKETLRVAAEEDGLGLSSWMLSLALRKAAQRAATKKVVAAERREGR